MTSIAENTVQKMLSVDDSLLDRRVVPLRHPWRWTATALVLVVVAQLLHGLVSKPFYEWDRFRYWFLRPVILEGLLVTLKVAAWSAVLGFLGGVVLAWAGSRAARSYGPPAGPTSGCSARSR